MLTILGRSDSRSNRFCDGMSRRNFLQIGGLAMGGLSLPGLLRAEGQQGVGSSHKAVINIFLGGGPPHQDMWDIKSDAPAEIRGEFKPISTKVAGIQIGECFPRIAGMMDKMVAIRSVVGSTGGHDAYQCVTGWRRGSMSSIGGMPSIGSALAKVRGPVDPAVPTVVRPVP